MSKKVGPNDPCPCGSGKKYKKCCRNKPGQRDMKVSKVASPKATGLTSFFHSAVSSRPAPIAPKEDSSSEKIKEDTASSDEVKKDAAPKEENKKSPGDGPENVEM